ncbi:ABC transporter substrate-binding protein [Caproicibacterium lactatifermentans]|nr:ABC transporter substrate-binding protein [Caproicibacterium lactatifermentans]
MHGKQMLLFAALSFYGEKRGLGVLRIKIFTRAMCGVLAAALLAGCGTAAASSAVSSSAAPVKSAVSADSSTQRIVTFQDALGYTVSVKSWKRVVAAYGSFAETWKLAGGSVVGVTSDAIEEKRVQKTDGLQVVGSVEKPNLEKILAASPDFVLLSASLPEHTKLHAALTKAGIPHAYFRVETFTDYLSMLQQLCSMTGRSDLYHKNGLEVQEHIQKIIHTVQGQPKPTALLIRAYSTNATVKGENSMTGAMLKDLGAVNVATNHKNLLENLSMESILSANPDFIFTVTMGKSDAKAQAHLKQTLQSNPGWASLSAVKNKRYYQLPKDLFHYKPNDRWGESYAYLAKILYPKLASQIS